jgi:flagellar assembly protein FliH
MPTVIRTNDHDRGTSSVAFNFDDMAAQARQYLDKVRAEGAKIIAAARHEAIGIRKQAEQEGRQAAAQAAVLAAKQTVEKQLTTVLPALRKVVDGIEHSRQTWLARWEASGVHVAAAIAKRLVRRELTHQPDIPLKLVREALQLAAGSAQVRVHLSPADHSTLGNQVQSLAQEMAGLGHVEIVNDPSVTPGGCRVETRFGTIDQQFETQLERIEEELQQ